LPCDSFCCPREIASPILTSFKPDLNLVGGSNPSEKYEFVSWDDDIPKIWKVISHVPNHQPASFKPGTGADSGPGVFNVFYFKHYVWICLKLCRRDDFVILPRIRNVVFVPRYARNLFVDH